MSFPDSEIIGRIQSRLYEPADESFHIADKIHNRPRWACTKFDKNNVEEWYLGEVCGKCYWPEEEHEAEEIE